MNTSSSSKPTIPALMATKQPLPPSPPPLSGAPLSRVDGPLKTTGSARYASDYNFPGTVYAVPVGASIASGKILKADTSVAEKMPGVLTILSHGNFDPVFRNASGGRNSEQRPPFEDETVYYWGQYVRARRRRNLRPGTGRRRRRQDFLRARQIQCSHGPQRPDDPRSEHPAAPGYSSHRGDAESAFAAAPVKIDYTYTTPVETHNPMEMHATVAVFDGKKFTLLTRAPRAS